MAKIIGGRIQGSVGELTYYVSRHGHIVKKKSRIDPQRLATDPALKRVRENCAEFGKGASAVKLLRSAFHSILKNTIDHSMTSRLIRAMLKVIKADESNEPGLRNVTDGQPGLLKDFEFNTRAKLADIFRAPYTAVINRVSGQLQLNIPSFIPADMVHAPKRATHFRIISCAAEIDFEKNNHITALNSSSTLLLDNTACGIINLDHVVTAKSKHPLFLLIGFEFYDKDMLVNPVFNSLAIVKVLE